MATQLTRRVLRVFLASPGDVREERDVAERVSADLNKIIGRHLQWQIDLHKWEDKSPSMGRPQSIINPDVDQCDLFVGLLWEHWGHPTGIYSSGFEEEFERAKARYQKTGEPQIWLVFKQPRPDKLTDPGPQLSGVLSFREKQIASNEVLFSTVKGTNEWERELSNWLTEHILGLSKPDQLITRPATSSPTAQSTDSKEPLESQGLEGQIPEQITDEFQILGKLIERNELEFWPGEEKLLREFDVARLHLLSSTWMSRRYTGDVLGTHEINQLYKYRLELQTAPQERVLLWRTLNNDSADLVPGWFWFREFKAERLSLLLFSFAKDDSLSQLRVQALQVLASAGIELPDSRWDLLPTADPEARIRWAAYDYLGAVANLDALPLLEQCTGNESDVDNHAASQARLHILARLDPESAFSELTTGAHYASDEMLRLIKLSLSKVKTPTLNKGLTTTDHRIRDLSAHELARRNELSIDDAEKLTKDPFIPIRKIGFEELIRRRRPVDLDKIKDFFSETEETPFYQLGRHRQLSDTFYGQPLRPDYSELADSVVLAFFRTLAPEELQKRIDWLKLLGPLAYGCLVSDHFGMIRDHIRDDIKGGFQRIRTAAFERLDASYSGEGVERLKKEIEELDSYIRDQFLEAAFAGLASHAEPSDLELARSYLSHPRATVKRAAAEIVGRFGTSDDAASLIAISNEPACEFKEDAAKCALRLSARPFEVAKTLTTSHTSELSALGFRWLLEDNSDPTRQFFENLLNDGLDSHRERAIYYLTKGATEATLQKFLEDYLEKESHYYNVITWLDRLVYAPAPLRAMYRRWLEKKM
jgi:hypothetical protein